MYTPYVLPAIEMVAGATKELRFNTFQKDTGIPFDVAAFTASFSMVNFVNKDSAPVVTKSATTNGTAVIVTLLPNDTVNLCGKYVYQVTISGGATEKEVCQGVLLIHKNIDGGGA